MSDTDPAQPQPDQEPDEAVGDFGDDDQSDAGGDSDTGQARWTDTA